MDFRNKKLHEIRLWAWAAAVLPPTALFGLWFIWSFGGPTLYPYAMILGCTLMSMIAVAWWWWAIYTIRNLVVSYDINRNDLNKVIEDIATVTNHIKQIKPK